MIGFLAGRLASLILTTLAASLVVFFLMEVLPGDPAAIILGVNARPDTLEAVRHELGLDLPVVTRYLWWIGRFAVGDLGTSYTYGVPVSDLVLARLTVSLPLALLAITLSTLIALPLGVLAAARRGGGIDALAIGFAQIGVAVPNFWLGLLLILLFALKLRWLPAGGFPGWSGGVWTGVKSLILPALALALPQAAILSRVTRAAVVETLHENYIRTARAKGRGAAGILWRHAVPNAMIPIVTIMGLQFSFLLAGTIIIENVFNLPGLGRLIFQAISQRDLVVVQALVTLLAAAVIAVNFVVDLTYFLLDPRLSAGKAP